MDHHSFQCCQPAWQSNMSPGSLGTDGRPGKSVTTGGAVDAAVLAATPCAPGSPGLASPGLLGKLGMLGKAGVFGKTGTTGLGTTTAGSGGTPAVVVVVGASVVVVVVTVSVTVVVSVVVRVEVEVGTMPGGQPKPTERQQNSCFGMDHEVRQCRSPSWQLKCLCKVVLVVTVDVV
mmetsp:Transcript_25099/g.58086  ORF Transcript_25099/g.58086 Transcript_25099/m.58086 type:complete len:176 (-) Transcript_25099:345-872(-)